jgi:sugar lactone lactonase YvrE
MTRNEHDDRRSENRSGTEALGSVRLTRRSALALGGVALGGTLLGGRALGTTALESGGQSGADAATQTQRSGDGTNEFLVTVTNLTPGQPFTPPLVALHQPEVEVFSVGEPATDAVRELAENGNLDPLVERVGATPEVRAAAVGDAPLVPRADPGETGNPYYATLALSADESATHLTFLGMLVATNDGFVGLDTVELPAEVAESRTLYAAAYDAGTEQNTERFEDLVPPAQSLIQGGEATGGTTESDPEIAEDDVVRPHPGIGGDGDLSPEVYGWDGPVAAVHVEKVASGEDPVVLFEFDPAAGELPENVAVDAEGAKYVSFPPLGQIRRVSPDNETLSTFAQFDVGDGTFLTGVVGVEVDRNGTVYACFVGDEDTDAHGVWSVAPDGTKSLFAEFPSERSPGDLLPETFPNDILVFDDGSLLVTDMAGGAVWRVRSGEAEVWAEGDLFEGTGDLAPYVVGANGIAATSDGTVYVGNFDEGHLVEIPVEGDGSAGTPEIFVEDGLLAGADGLAVDVQDNIYVAVNGQNAIRRVAPSGTIETLARGGDLDSPSDVTFGTTRGEQTALFVTNLAFSDDPKPSLMRLEVGVPGRPVQR